jgi:hypothetical protein
MESISVVTLFSAKLLVSVVARRMDTDGTFFLDFSQPEWISYCQGLQNIKRRTLMIVYFANNKNQKKAGETLISSFCTVG